MPDKTESRKQEGFAYARSLLEQRREQLRELEQSTAERSDCLSCRRSLEQAINELEALLQAEEGSGRTAQGNGNLLTYWPRNIKVNGESDGGKEDECINV